LLSLGAPAAAQFQSPSYKFIKAVENRDGATATELLQTNPPGLINFKDAAGNTPLIIAINRQDYNWTGFLINKGADANIAGKGGETPLIAASRIGFRDAVDWLLKAGAKVDGTNRMGETPLIIAVQQRQTELVRLFLRMGADPDKTDSAAGLSARDYAARDTRSRQILQLIEASKPKAGTPKK
jgi:ankyrin repeat protein